MSEEPHNSLRISLGWLVAYLAFAGIVVAGVLYGRHQAIQVYGSNEAQADWDAWRADATKMAEAPSVVKRRAPKAVEPPALVLMRDYFGVCLLLAIVLSTVLFGTFMVFVRGAFAPESRFIDRSRK